MDFQAAAMVNEGRLRGRVVARVWVALLCSQLWYRVVVWPILDQRGQQLRLVLGPLRPRLLLLFRRGAGRGGRRPHLRRR